MSAITFALSFEFRQINYGSREASSSFFFGLKLYTFIISQFLWIRNVGVANPDGSGTESNKITVKMLVGVAIIWRFPSGWKSHFYDSSLLGRLMGDLSSTSLDSSRRLLGHPHNMAQLPQNKEFQRDQRVNFQSQKSQTILYTANYLLEASH